APAPASASATIPWANALFSIQCVDISTHIFLHPLSPILHNEPRVGERDDFVEESVVAVQLHKVLEIFSFTQAEASFSVEGKNKLCIEALYDEGVQAAFKLRVVVVVHVLAVQHKPEGRHCTDIETSVEGFWSAVGFNHAVDKVGGKFSSFIIVVFYPTILFKFYGIGKRNACYAPAEAPGINAQNGNTRCIVVIIFPVKALHQREGPWVGERVHHVYAFRQRAGIGKFSKKV